MTEKISDAELIKLFNKNKLFDLFNMTVLEVDTTAGNIKVEFDIDKNQIDREMGYENFAVNLFTFQSLEILYLKRAGHRRAIFEWLNNDVKKNWLIP